MYTITSRDVMKPLTAASLFLAASLPSIHAEKTLLFVDDADILYRSGTVRELVPLKKYEGNPVIAPDKPWEGMIGWVSVYRNPQNGLFQMWYQAYNDKRTEDKSLRCVVAYAESKDGKNWVKPNLGLFPYYEEKDTNIVLIGAPNAYGDRYCNSVLVDPKDPDPARRYKMMYYDWDPDDEKNVGAGSRVAFSPDGIHWTKHESMVHKTSYGAKGKQPPFEDESIFSEIPAQNGKPAKKSWLVPISMSDAQDVFYDDLKGVYVGYGKMWMHGPDGGSHWKHGMGRIESKDFIHWSKPQFLLGPTDDDAPQLEFHTSPVFLYNGQYFSLNQILDRSAGIMDIELMTSRDGLEWTRPFPGKFILTRGTGAVFDAATLLTNGNAIPMGDQVWFYYGGYRGTAIGGVGLDKQVIGSGDYHSGVGLATMEKDRFVAIAPDPDVNTRNSLKVNRDTVGKAAPKPVKANTVGQITLRPMDLSKVREITLNADASQGSIAVELLNEDGYRVRGFSKDDATPITENSLNAKVAWKDSNLSALKPKKYMLRIHLNNAKLYACTLK